MKYRVMTTIHAAGWEAYGRRMAESVIKHWSPDLLPLILYAEGFDPEPMEGIEVRQLPAWIDEFKARFALPAYRGATSRGYDYRFDAVKFAHKIAALTDCAAGLTDETLIWLDADTFTHAGVDAAWLDSLFPDPNGYLAWLDRAHSHPECGFVFYRCGHPYHQAFIGRLRELYETGQIFNLPETHDSYVLWHLVRVKVANRKIPAPTSLSGPGYRTGHVLANSPLSTRLDHAKGPRKFAGRTPKNERRLIADGNPYWS